MTETAQTVKDVVETIMPYLQQAADKLGTTAEYLWALQVKQAYVTGVNYLVHYLFCFLVFYAMYRFFKYMFTKGDFENDWGNHKDYRYQADDNLFFGGCLIGGILTTICGLYVLGSINEVLTIFINPEYWGLNQVLLLLKGGIKL